MVIAIMNALLLAAWIRTRIVGRIAPSGVSLTELSVTIKSCILPQFAQAARRVIGPYRSSRGSLRATDSEKARLKTIGELSEVVESFLYFFVT